MSRYFIVSGELSGDKLGGLIGQGLIEKGHEVHGWGGDNMNAAGVTITRNISDLKVMGWTDVLQRLPSLLGLLSKCKKDITFFLPDTIILIDFGSFNMRVGRWAKDQGFRVVYYSPPKVWASRSGRINELKEWCDEIIVLFPFERDYYQSKGVSVSYFGHPVANIIKSYHPELGFRSRFGLDSRPILAVLPGSRKNEIERTLTIYLEAMQNFNEYQICISAAPGMSDIINLIINQKSYSATIVEKGYYDLLHFSEFALITSGTATLEAALFRVPQIVGYRTNLINYLIARALIKTKFISLPNLLANRKIVTELIQYDLNAKNIQRNIIRICQVDAKSILENDYNGIINEITLDKCLFNTIVAICGEKT